MSRHNTFFPYDTRKKARKVQIKLSKICIRDKPGKGWDRIPRKNRTPTVI